MSFQKGDVVILKSGGPNMTVMETGDYSDFGGPADGVKCCWFSKTGTSSQLQEQVFDAAGLDKYEPRTAPLRMRRG